MIDPTAAVHESVLVFGDRGKLRVGRHSRIDAGCVISVGPEGVEIGDYVHLAVGVCLFGGSGKVTIGSCCFCSPRSVVYTATDDMGADCLVGPTIPERFRAVRTGDVTFRDCSGIGTGAIVFPGVTLGLGAVVGALSIATRDVVAGHVVVGPNQRVVRTRSIGEINRRRLALLRGEA